MKRLLLLLCLPLLCCTQTFSQRSDSTIIRYLQQEYDIPFSTNNRVVVFKTGQEKFDDLFAAVRQARHSIHLEYFNFRNDSISGALFDLLAAKAAEGVEVRALFDGFGNSSNDRPLRRHHVDSLRRRGIEIHEFDPLRFPWINHAFHRDHRKIVVIDGVIAYTGGMNVADYYINGKPEFGEWRDIHLRIEGEAVAGLQGVFLNFWNQVTEQEVQGPEYYPGTRPADRLFTGLRPDTSNCAGEKHVGVVDRTPGVTPKIMHDTFLHAIDGAQDEVLIISPYLTLCRHLKKSLKRASKRGVKVKIMVSAKSDIPITPRIVEYNVHQLMQAGAEIYFFEGGFHHSKIMMVDSAYAFVGSANLNNRSLSFDYECNLLIADSCTTRQLCDIFYHDVENCCFRLTPERWQEMPWRKRFLGWLFHFLSPFTLNDSGTEGKRLRTKPSEGDPYDAARLGILV